LPASRTASHITSEAIAPSAVAFTDSRPRDDPGVVGRSISSVVTAKSVSPSMSVWNGWMPRCIELCTCLANWFSSTGLIRTFVTIALIVVLPASVTGGTCSANASW
jgi:hypothetical protein